MLPDDFTAVITLKINRHTGAFSWQTTGHVTQSDLDAIYTSLDIVLENSRMKTLMEPAIVKDRTVN